MSIDPRNARAFLRREEGAVAMLFGLTFLVILLCVGVAIDIARAYHANNKAANALDAAALAAAKAMREQSSLSDGQIKQIAQDFFTANIAGAGIGKTSFDPIEAVITRTSGTVQASVNGVLDTYFVRIAGPSFKTIPITRDAAATYSLIDVELGVMLDVTGSMGDPSPGGSTKIADLRVAVKELNNIMLPSGGQPGKVRIGLAPFSGSVNLGTYADDVSANRSTDGCVIERTKVADRYTDENGVVSPFGIKGDFATASSYSCPPSKLQPLTDDKAKLDATADSLVAGGCTAGHLGTTWAWNLISDKWNGIWNLPDPITPYNDGKTVKAVILMTDGIFNTSYISAPNNCNGTGLNPTSRNYAKQLCDAMKTKGVIVYTIGFMLTDPNAQATMAYCASGPTRAILAENKTELTAAFTNIAIQLNNLRLSK
jgi:Flp pilus assembly protein TadG